MLKLLTGTTIALGLMIGSGLADWTTIAAGTFLFLLPVAIFTFLLRGHLLRGVTFGAIRK